MSEEIVVGCPFCGKTPTVKAWNDGGQDTYMVVCSNTACPATSAVTGATRAGAIRRWNIRKAKSPMDRRSCGTCKHFKDVGYQHWGECTAQVPCWAWGEYIETTRQVFRDGSTADLAPDCEAYKPNTRS